MAVTRFRNILFLPPPDCLHCKRQTYLAGVPARFKPANSYLYSGCRGLCNVCYRFLCANDRATLNRYPTVYRRSTETYKKYLLLKQEYPRWSKREIAIELLKISPNALEQAICRARRLERGEKADQPPKWRTPEVAA